MLGKLIRKAVARTALPIVVACVQALLNGCGGGEVTCHGVCPAPAPGILVDAGMVDKSVWLTEDRLGPPDGARSSLCTAQVNNTPEDEIIFSGDDGVAIVTADGGQAGDAVFVPIGPGESLHLIDTNGDGNVEYVLTGLETFHYYGSDASMLTALSSGWDFYALDFDGDGLVELVVLGPEEVTVLNADGSARARLNRDGRVVRISTVIATGAPVIVLAETWEDRESGQIWSPDGQLLTDLSAGDLYAADRPMFPREGSVDFSCHRCDVFNSEYPTVTLGPLHVEFSYTQAWTSGLTIFLEYSVVDTATSRTILKMFDSSDSLVYHEVLDSQSGPCSFVVVGSGDDSEEMLLVAADEQILAYAIH